MRNGGGVESRAISRKRCPIGRSTTGKSGKSGSIDWTSTYNNCKQRRRSPMTGSSTANSDSFKVTTAAENKAHEMRMTRLFNAPRNLVFEAMTKPEHVKRWWG